MNPLRLSVNLEESGDDESLERALFARRRAAQAAKSEKVPPLGSVLAAAGARVASADRPSPASTRSRWSRVVPRREVLAGVVLAAASLAAGLGKIPGVRAVVPTVSAPSPIVPDRYDPRTDTSPALATSAEPISVCGVDPHAGVCADDETVSASETDTAADSCGGSLACTGESDCAEP